MNRTLRDSLVILGTIALISTTLYSQITPPTSSTTIVLSNMGAFSGSYQPLGTTQQTLQNGPWGYPEGTTHISYRQNGDPWKLINVITGPGEPKIFSISVNSGFSTPHQIIWRADGTPTDQIGDGLLINSFTNYSLSWSGGSITYTNTNNQTSNILTSSQYAIEAQNLSKDLTFINGYWLLEN